ncbi:YveK family protein [Lacticaseibacillus jixianensis]|uniref:Capsular polysaccharide biosynthesis protein CpsC n=1 Tax=Lacticaseibacillus jixianensis TaxID=2486012 RepID=A0ABW4BBZ4_9LACO|nr:Wzz/FepE/Etk N-terminal domain-containing protein [Lacticaseibacillus jixianensis]
MQEISLGELLRVLYKRFWIIALITVGVTVLIGGYRAVKTGHSAQYEATGQVVLTPEEKSSQDVATQNAYANQLIATSQDLIQSTEALSLTSAKLSKEGISLPTSAIQSGLSVANKPNSLLLEIKYKGADQQIAVKTVKTIMQNFKTLAPKYMAVSRVAIIKGDIPVSASSSRRSLIKYSLAGFVLGGVLSLIVVFILEFSRHTVRDEKYLSKKYHIQTIQTL